MASLLNGFEAWENSVPKHANKNLKEYDLQIGDKVKHTYHAGSGKEREIITDFWIVTGVYPNVFTVKNRKDEKSSFTRAEYQIGQVVKVIDNYE